MISIIVAIAQDEIIGGQNQLLWHISEDLKRFKAITSGHPVVMGRKTFESLGRPLPKRTNVVITRNPELKIEGCTMATSLQNAIDLFPKSEEIFIIGGGEIYRQAMPLADKLYITRVHNHYCGDTTFPTIDSAIWQQIECQPLPNGADFPHPFTYITYTRK